MSVPMNPSNVIVSFCETIANCATFRRLVGAADIASAKASIYFHMTFDTFEDGTDETDPDRQPIDPYPRMNLIEGFPQTTDIVGYSPLGHGVVEAYLEFKQFTDQQIADWYSTSLEENNSREHWKHAYNLKNAIRNEIIATANGIDGCLEIPRLVDDVVGKIDTVSNNGMNIWCMVFQAHWIGLP
jgi:hypothetical protein